MDFIQGEHVIMNTNESPLTHMKKAIVITTNIDDPTDPTSAKKKILVGLDTESGYKNYLVYPEQLYHIEKFPGFDNFMSQLSLTTTPVETEEETTDREQDELVTKINAEKKLHNVAFNEGYDKGWQDAVVHFQGIMKKHGY